ncbi:MULTISPECIES: glucose-1-phosphate cytidylyltransferase [unclassified Pseudofrankia]|uniref:glucose-1-phosphate cytidylyltransferase n=1 Tax=unclassified Pseudofrankia TaxID=2994372 RepID=UPI0008DA1750|nr:MULTISPECIES: glucose-1-phosphate cytidylyltransferase [unclassified Pseudofrankia]MDT3443513.1 glucose-1-phosphate cytidylyltransferase [Pseudofrankia sp. BMG5.37]OHV42721.1 glucose-1-phosphate cytidylyltransferase [Pseudofrankia sp. BMG5.36]
MKIGILAGGLGSRLAEETTIKPKPMVEIGNQPIMWHIMKYYAHFGLTDFAVALGYRGEYIKRWLVDYASLASDLTVSLRDGTVYQHEADGHREDWSISLVETGQDTNTGGRIKRLQRWIGTEGTFMLTWGDGVSDIDLHALLDFHRAHGKLATLTAVRPPARFGHLEIDDDSRITEFSEKPQTGEGWINGAFFVLEPGIFDYIEGDLTQFEKEPLEELAKDGQLMAYRHGGFWQCMDTVRDRRLLQSLWDSGNAPWKVWA